MKEFLVDIGAPVPKKYHTRPAEHEKYKWISQDQSQHKLADIDDNHLLNIYLLLKRSIAMNEDLRMNYIVSKAYEETSAVNEIIIDLEENMCHVAYEVHVRGLFVSKSKLFEEIQDGRNKDN